MVTLPQIGAWQQGYNRWVGKRLLLLALVLFAFVAIAATAIWMRGKSPKALLFAQEIGPGLISAPEPHSEAWLINGDKLLLMDLFGGLEQYEIQGRKLWEYDHDHSPIWMLRSVAEDGAAYLGGMKGELLAVGADGKEQWRRKLAGSRVWSVCPTVASDGRVYVAVADENLYALDSSGETLWHVEDPSIRGRSAPTVTPDGSTIIITTVTGGMWAYARDGQPLWQNNSAVPLVIQPAFNSKGEMVILEPSGQISIIDCSNGSMLTSFSTGRAVEDKLTILSNDDICCIRSGQGTRAELVCFDPSGQLRFSRPIGSMFSRILADSRGGLFVLESGEERAEPLRRIPYMSHSNARLLRLDNQGNELAKVNLPFMFAFTNLLQRADGSVLVYGIDGKLYCFDL